MVGPQQFRDLMAGVCAPVTIVTTMDEGQPFGATVSAFASLSLDPPMVTVALDRVFEPAGPHSPGRPVRGERAGPGTGRPRGAVRAARR